MTVDLTEKIAKITIRRATAGTTQTGFGQVLIMEAHAYWEDRYREFADCDELEAAGVPTTSRLYRAANAIMSQEPAPENFAVGRKAIGTIRYLPDTTSAAVGEEFTLTLDDVDYTYTASGGEDEAAISTALNALIVAAGIDVTPNGFYLTDNTSTARGLVFSCSSNILWTPALIDVIKVEDIQDMTTYTVVVRDPDGTNHTYSYTTGAGAVGLDIVQGLEAAVELGGLFDAQSGTDGVDFFLAIERFPVASDQDQQADLLHLTVTANLSISAEGGGGAYETWATALAAVRNEDDSWYWFGTTHRDSRDQFYSAVALQSASKFPMYASADPYIINETVSADLTSIMALLKNANYSRGSVLYGGLCVGDATDDWRDFALMGILATWDLDIAHPHWAIQTLTGCTVDTLTETQVNNVHDKYGIVFVDVRGVNITLCGDDGNSCGNEWGDTIVGCDWLAARLEEAVINLLVSAAAIDGKVPLSSAGIASVEAALREVLDKAVQVKFFRAAIERGKQWQPGGYMLTMPTIADISDADRAARVLSGITAKGVIAGAVNRVEVTAIIEV